MNLIDVRHELCRLAERMRWQELVDQFGALYAEQGRPGVPIRLMVGLHYLKHAYGLSDEVIVRSWVENPYWQYFCGGPGNAGGEAGKLHAGYGRYDDAREGNCVPHRWAAVSQGSRVAGADGAASGD